MAQLRTVFWSYKQRGLVATVATDEPNTTALQVFLPTGPLALLPVRGGFSNIVWSTTPARAAELEAMSPEEFVSAVNVVSLLAAHTRLLQVKMQLGRVQAYTRAVLLVSASSLTHLLCPCKPCPRKGAQKLQNTDAEYLSPCKQSDVS